MIEKLFKRLAVHNQIKSEQFGVCATEFGLVSYRPYVADVERRVAYRDPNFEQTLNFNEYVVCEEVYRVDLASSKVTYSQLPSFKLAFENEFFEDGEEDLVEFPRGTVYQEFERFECVYGGFDDTVTAPWLKQDDFGGVNKDIILRVINPRKYPHFTECMPKVPN